MVDIRSLTAKIKTNIQISIKLQSFHNFQEMSSWKEKFFLNNQEWYLVFKNTKNAHCTYENVEVNCFYKKLNTVKFQDWK